MSKGRRYEGEQKLNLKKVFAVIIAIAVIIMFIIGIKHLFSAKSTTEEKTVALKYFPVYTDNKWGVIDSKGNTIISPEYDEYIVIPDNTKPIFICTYDVDYEKGTYKTKVINEKNEEIYTDYNNVEALENYDENNNLWYEDGIFRVEQDGKYGVIDTNGKLLVSPEYDSIEALQGVDKVLLTEKNGKFGIIDNVGTVIIDNNYKKIEPISSKYEDGFIVEAENGKYGVISYTKTTELETKYDDIKKIYSNGKYYAVKENNKWEVVSEDGQKYLEGAYDDIVSINGENVIVKNNNKYGVVQVTDNKKIIDTTYEEISYGSDNKYIVKSNNKYGIIDASGNKLVDFKYESITYRDIADFYEATNSDYTSDLIDANMNVKLSNVILSELNTTDGYMKVRENNQDKYYNFKFEEKNVQNIFAGNTLFLSKNQEGKYGFVDKNGNVVVNYIYYEAREQNDYGYASVKQNDLWGAIDSKGNVVVEPSYKLENNALIQFIGKWHLGEDLNLYYFTDE